MPAVWVGTDQGLHAVDDGDVRFPGRSVDALARDGTMWWGLVDERELHSGILGPGPERAATLDDGDLMATCLLPGDAPLVGTSRAGLFRLAGARLERVEGFDRIDGRDGWYTPWGGPPDTRSMARDADARIYVNVHVGGIPASGDDGATFEPTIDVDADVHQVIAHPTRPGVVLAAGANGLSESADGGGSWRLTNEGLHAPYCRAVAFADDVLLLSASTGPRRGRAAVYRRALDDPGQGFARCVTGLPDWFDGNIDTSRLAAAGGLAAFGTQDGRVFVSEDAGETWEERAAGLPGINCVVIDAG